MFDPSHIVEVAAAVITRPDGSFLLARRPDGKPYAGYWEFPGGKVEPGEPLLHALRRELLEELGIYIQHAYPWITRTFTYTHATVRLSFYRVVKWYGEAHPYENQELSWQFTHDISVEPMLPANAPILRALDLPAVYGITNAAESGVKVSLIRMERALQEGLRLVQVREKKMTEKALQAFAGEMVALAHHHGARVLINGNAELCREVGADGVHFPSTQLMNLMKLPDIEWCGASCHNVEELFQAEQLGMDFAVLAPVLPTLSHPHSQTLGWRKFAAFIRECSIPVYALGGLHQDDIATAWDHGGHGIAIMRGIT
ncbi:MAG: Nudix family hydrolase [Nitrosospira sp.]|nr:Nudix family hydrolase [Nitrosospira sp.]